ncbi:IST1-like [Oopsacas minuta]|uniref:IST1 homolog n=1 Tax=Oopsacas minuta TaxID=111878 RepID=A0AAV7JJV1_9METZ|nr:IST1-like [Oopsacas minuta]
MLGGGFKSSKLQVNLKLSMQRFKLLEKKKTEQAMKARREIADLIKNGRIERARIKVEHIVREDYLVEAMEILELYCDLLLARMGLLETMAYCEEGLSEAVNTLIWATPRLQADVQELEQVSKQLSLKFGKTFGEQARANRTGAVNEKVIHRLGVQAPSPSLVEQYMSVIAKNYNVHYDLDTSVMIEGNIPEPITEKTFQLDPRGPSPPSGPGYPPSFGGPPPSSYPPSGPSFNNPPYPPSTQQYSPQGAVSPYPPPSGGAAPYPPQTAPGLPSSHPHNPSEENLAYPPNSSPPSYPDVEKVPLDPGYPPQSQAESEPTAPAAPDFELPSVPNSNPPATTQDDSDDDLDLDDLSRRFEELKKKK